MAAASRNKRKHEMHPDLPSAAATGDPNGASFVRPFQLFPVGCPQEGFTARGQFGMANFDNSSGSCDMCQALSCGHGDGRVAAASRWDRCERATDWDITTESQLEDLLLQSLDFVYESMINTIRYHGCIESAPMAAILAVTEKYGLNANVASGIANHALSLYKEQQEGGLKPEFPVGELLRDFEKALLDKMVSLVCETHPCFSIGDAMWCLLMSDMNVALACSPDYGTSNDSMNKQSSVTQMTEPNGKGAISFSKKSMNSRSGSNENSVVKLEQVEEVICTLPLQALKGVKPFISGKKVTVGTSRRDAILHHKSITLEKNLRAIGSKAAIRASKHGALGSVVLDCKGKSTLDSASINLKSSSRISKLIAASVTQGELSVDLCSSAELLPSTIFELTPSSTSFELTPFSAASGASRKEPIMPKSSAAPTAKTELSLSRPATSVANQEVKEGEPNPNYASNNFANDNTSDGGTPQDKMDEMALRLVQRLQALQARLQDWSDWAQKKVMQVTHRLGKEKEELYSLRQEKEEVCRLQEERRSLEESTKKRLTEMDSAIMKATVQVERTNAASRRLDCENSQLRLELENAKARAEHSAANCRDLSQKLLKSLKNFQLWDSEKAHLQEELATEKCKLSILYKNIEQAKELHEQVQSRWRNVESSKDEAIARVNIERKEKQQIEMSARSQENSLLVSMQNDVQRYKNEICLLVTKLKNLDSSGMVAPWCQDKSYATHVSGIPLCAFSAIAANVTVYQDPDYDDFQRERECVMCLNAEMSVVFLPCAHQVVCTDCNRLHEKQGMKDCPSCRTPIHRRICARPLLT